MPNYDMIAVIKASRERRRRVLKMRERGMTYEEIASELGVTRQRAYSIHHEAKRDESRQAKAA